MRCISVTFIENEKWCRNGNKGEMGLVYLMELEVGNPVRKLCILMQDSIWCLFFIYILNVVCLCIYTQERQKLLPGFAYICILQLWTLYLHGELTFLFELSHSVFSQINTKWLHICVWRNENTMMHRKYNDASTVYVCLLFYVCFCLSCPLPKLKD